MTIAAGDQRKRVSLCKCPYATILTRRPVSVQFESVNHVPVIDEEAAQERHVIGGSDAREIPEGMVEHNQCLSVAIERLQETC